MTDEELIPLIPLIKAWLNKFEAELLVRLEAGEEIPGASLVPKRPTRKWIDETKVIEAFSPVIPIDKLCPRTLLSPAQLESILKELKLDVESARSFQKAESSGPTIRYSKD